MSQCGEVLNVFRMHVSVCIYDNNLSVCVSVCECLCTYVCFGERCITQCVSV